MNVRPMLVLASLAVSGAIGAQTAAPCYEPGFGTLLGAADDAVFPAITLGTPFPAFSTLWFQVEVSSNGFV